MPMRGLAGIRKIHRAVAPVQSVARYMVHLPHARDKAPCTRSFGLKGGFSPGICFFECFRLLWVPNIPVKLAVSSGNTYLPYRRIIG